MIQLLFWITLLLVGTLGTWAMHGNGSIVLLEKPNIGVSIFFFLLGLNLVISHGIKLFNRFF